MLLMINSLLVWLLNIYLIPLSLSLQPKSVINKSLCSKSDLLLATSFIDQTPLQSVPFSINECDMITDGPMCLAKGDRMFLPFASKKGLNGYWNFDEEKPLDQSLNKNHAYGTVAAGPSFGGYGSSAYFNDGNYIYIPHSDSFSSSLLPNFSLTFLIFIKKDTNESKGIQHCPIIQKGNDDLLAKTYQRNPAIYYERKEKKVHVYIKTDNTTVAKGEEIVSNGMILPSKWYHIAVVKDNSNVYLYLNGLLDSKLALTEMSQSNTSPLYIGNVPWLKADCQFPYLIDELRYYSIALDQNYIQAEAAPILGGIEPSFIELSCLNCSLNKAAGSCREGYRLCTSIELHTGGYQIARSLGLITFNTTIWTHNLITEIDKYQYIKGLGLCCAILK